jgi:hypothetical protein
MKSGRARSCSGTQLKMDPRRLQAAWVAAIERRDADAMEEVMCEHLKRGRKVRVETMLKQLSQRAASTKRWNAQSADQALSAAFPLRAKTTAFKRLASKYRV